MIKIGLLGTANISNLLFKIYKNDLYSDNFDKIDETLFISKKDDICFTLVDIGKSKTDLTDKDIILLNSDKQYNMFDLKSYKAKVITYGLNLKACITASSIRDEDYKTIQICIQRAIPTISGNMLEEQEFPIKIMCYDDVNAVLAAVTIALINDFELDQIKSCVF